MIGINVDTHHTSEDNNTSSDTREMLNESKDSDDGG